MSVLFDNPKPLFVEDDENPNAGTTVTGLTLFESTRLDTLGGSHAAIHVIWDGTVTGVLLVQSSNDNPADKDAQDWVNEPDVNVPTQPAGAPGSTMIHVFHNGARWIRITHSNSAGSGNLRALANVKV